MGYNPLDTPNVGNAGGWHAFANRIRAISESGDLSAGGDGVVYEDQYIQVNEGEGGKEDFYAGPDGVRIERNLTLGGKLTIPADAISPFGKITAYSGSTTIRATPDANNGEAAVMNWHAQPSFSTKPFLDLKHANDVIPWYAFLTTTTDSDRNGSNVEYSWGVEGFAYYSLSSKVVSSFVNAEKISTLDTRFEIAPEYGFLTFQIATADHGDNIYNDDSRSIKASNAIFTRGGVLLNKPPFNNDENRDSDKPNTHNDSDAQTGIFESAVLVMPLIVMGKYDLDKGEFFSYERVPVDIWVRCLSPLIGGSIAYSTSDANGRKIAPIDSEYSYFTVSSDVELSFTCFEMYQPTTLDSLSLTN